jgi:hypothetical protein
VPTSEFRHARWPLIVDIPAPQPIVPMVSATLMGGQANVEPRLGKRKLQEDTALCDAITQQIHNRVGDRHNRGTVALREA